MYNIELQWLQWNVDLDAVAAYVVGLEGSNYIGASAGYDLSLHFTAQPSSDNIAAIKAYWSEIDAGSPCVLSYCSRATINAAIAAARADMVTKSWDQLSTAQKKLIAGLTPTRTDLGL